MKWISVAGVTCAVGVLAACGQVSGPLAPNAATGPAMAQPSGAVALGSTGGGRYMLLGTIDSQFAFGANQNGDGGASGRFHQALEFQGQHVEFHGVVTCVSVDAVNGRAWIGGVITENRSEHPAFLAARNQPGRDIWFRVLDAGEGEGAEADRTTFVGFEGDAGFATSADYCAGQPWPDGNDRTWPVTSGNIQVRP
jgi:hypothetical protein